jgi:hypothetical protein
MSVFAKALAQPYGDIVVIKNSLELRRITTSFDWIRETRTRSTLHTAVRYLRSLMPLSCCGITCSGLFSGSEGLLLHHSRKRGERNAC